MATSSRAERDDQRGSGESGAASLLPPAKFAEEGEFGSDGYGGTAVVGRGEDGSRERPDNGGRPSSEGIGGVVKEVGMRLRGVEMVSGTAVTRGIAGESRIQNSGTEAPELQAEVRAALRTTEAPPVYTSRSAPVAAKETAEQSSSTIRSAERSSSTGRVSEPPQPSPPLTPSKAPAAEGDGTTGAANGTLSEKLAAEENTTFSDGPGAATGGMTAPALSPAPRLKSRRCSGKDRLAAANAVAAAASKAAILASAEAEAAAEAAAVAVAEAEVALEAVAEGDASSHRNASEPERVDATAVQTVEATQAAAAASDEGKAVRECSAMRGAFPPLFLDPTDSGCGPEAAAPTTLTGSVSAEVFSTRSQGGACPWPSSSDGKVDDGGDDGFGGSSRNRMSVEESAAFMNLGSTGRGDGGGGFASGSSWATTGTSAVADIDRVVAMSGTAFDESFYGAEALADGGRGSGGPGRGFHFASGGGGGFALGGLPFDGSSAGRCIGPDDFLSASSIGLGALQDRRISADAALPPPVSSGGDVAKDLGTRRSTVAEMVGRGGDLSSDSSALVAGRAVTEDPDVALAVAEGGAAGGDQGDGGDGGGDGNGGTELPPSKPTAVEHELAKTQEDALALFVRRGEEDERAIMAVVEEAGAAGYGAQSSVLAIANGRGVVAKSTDGGDVRGGSDSLETSCTGRDAGRESVATSFAGAEGGKGPPLRELEVPAPRVVSSGGGGCCVVS